MRASKNFCILALWALLFCFDAKTQHNVSNNSPSEGVSCPQKLEDLSPQLVHDFSEYYSTLAFDERRRKLDRLLQTYDPVEIQFLSFWMEEKSLHKARQSCTQRLSALQLKNRLEQELLNAPTRAKLLSHLLELKKENPIPSERRVPLGPWELRSSDNQYSGIRSQEAMTPFAAKASTGQLRRQNGSPFPEANVYTARDFLQVHGAPSSTKSRFDKTPFPRNSPYNQDWIYESTFQGPELQEHEKLWLDLEGLNYRAQVEINGQKITPHSLVGSYRIHKLDISPFLKSGQNNQIRITATPPRERVEDLPSSQQSNASALARIGSLDRSYLDWHATPPDKNMGLHTTPTLSVSGSHQIKRIHSNVELSANHDLAELNLNVEIEGDPKNLAPNTSLSIELNGQMASIPVNQLKFHTEELTGKHFIKILSSDFELLRLKNPRLWWPSGKGPQNLYNLRVSLVDPQQKLIHSRSIQTAIRQTRLIKDDNGALKALINGEEIALVGAGWSGDFSLNESLENKRIKLELLKNAGINTIRQEGTMESDEFYKLADQMGMMVLAGWPCCTQWEASPEGTMWGVRNPAWKWNDEKYDIATRSLSDQISRLNEHPSFLGWFNGSDFAPHQKLEERYKEIYQNQLGKNWEEKVIARASSSRDSRPSALFEDNVSKMEGPYSQSAEELWTDPQSKGFVQGFHSELGVGDSDISWESLQSMAPELSPETPINEVFKSCREAKEIRDRKISKEQRKKQSEQSYRDALLAKLLINRNLINHSGISRFGNLGFSYLAICEKFGQPTTLGQYMRMMRLLSYLNYRSMAEGFREKRDQGANGFVLWMSTNAWPTTRWHLVGQGGDTNAAYAGFAKGNESVHPQYSYHDSSLIASNNTRETLSKLSLDIRVYDPDSNVIETQNIEIPKLSPGENLRVGEFAREEIFRALAEEAQKNGDYRTIERTVRVPYQHVVTPEQTIKKRFFGRSRTIPAVTETRHREEKREERILNTPNVVLLSMQLKDSNGSVISSNSYPLSQNKNTLHHNRSEWWRTPATQVSQSDLLKMDQNPAQILAARAGSEANQYFVTLKNPSADKVSLANFVQIREKNGSTIPQNWSENMITLRPGEEREISVQLQRTAQAPEIVIEALPWPKE